MDIRGNLQVLAGAKQVSTKMQFQGWLDLPLQHQSRVHKARSVEVHHPGKIEPKVTGTTETTETTETTGTTEMTETTEMVETVEKANWSTLGSRAVSTQAHVSLAC